MEQFEKWWNEEQSKEVTDEFLIENALVTYEQAVDLFAKAAWRAALEWVLEEFSLSPIGNKAIREELEGGD